MADQNRRDIAAGRHREPRRRSSPRRRSRCSGCRCVRPPSPSGCRRARCRSRSASRRAPPVRAPYRDRAVIGFKPTTTRSGDPYEIDRRPSTMQAATHDSRDSMLWPARAGMAFPGDGVPTSSVTPGLSSPLSAHFLISSRPSDTARRASAAIALWALHGCRADAQAELISSRPRAVIARAASPRATSRKTSRR